MTAGLHHARLAAGEPANAGRVDGLPGRGHRAAPGEVRHLPGAAGRVRRCARTSSRTPAWERGLLRRAGRCRCPAPTWPATRRSVRTRPWSARRAQAGLPAGAARSPPATPRRSTTAPPRCCSARERPRPHSGWPAGPDRRPRRRTRQRAAALRLRAGRGREQGPAPGRHRLADVGAVELNEAFAAQSLACLDAWGDRPARSSTRTAGRSRSAIRWAPPAAASSAPWPGLRERRRRWGVAAHLHRRRPGPRRGARERRSRGRCREHAASTDDRTRRSPASRTAPRC